MSDKPAAEPRPRPCASCPYRADVPAGVWEADEYAKLTRYDAPTSEQPIQMFMCHQQDGRICSGWLACHDPGELLAVRIAAIRGDVDPSIFDYSTTVPLFGSGAEAAAHGLSGVDNPDERAVATMAKVLRTRKAPA